MLKQNYFNNMEINRLEINKAYNYVCGYEPVKVKYIGKSKDFKATHVFKALEGAGKGINDTLSEKSVENFIQEIPQ